MNILNTDGNKKNPEDIIKENVLYSNSDSDETNEMPIICLNLPQK